MEVPEGWTARNKPEPEESLSWKVVTRLDNVRVGVSLYVRGAGGKSDSFFVELDGSRQVLHHHSDVWKWSSALSFNLRRAGTHTLKVMLREDGSRVHAVKLTPAKHPGDNFPVWFAPTEPHAFTTGVLSHDPSGMCMVSALLLINCANNVV